MYTTYDEMVDKLREDMEKCLEQALALVVEKDVWGYQDVDKDYGIEVYKAIEDAIEKI